MVEYAVSGDCTLPPMIVLAECMSGRDPCAGCNADRKVCRGRPRKE